MVHECDWLELPARVEACSVDFVYADPPFNTGVTKRSPSGAGRLGRQSDAEYQDDFGSSAAFVEWLEARVSAVLPLMKGTGLIALHVDWRSSHHVRLLLDRLLGEDRFVNHLIWSYGLGGSSPRRFARKHDDILLYCLDPETYYFEPPMVPATSQRMRGKMKKATDVLDVLQVPSLNNMATERTGYPTQKPVALLELLIGACSPPGGVVMDPCCGSGTAAVAAVKLGRRAVVSDISPDAVRTVRERLAPLTGV